MPDKRASVKNEKQYEKLKERACRKSARLASRILRARRAAAGSLPGRGHDAATRRRAVALRRRKLQAARAVARPHASR